METLAYKPHLADVLARLRSLYQRQAGDRAFARMDVPLPALDDFRRHYAAGYCEEPDVESRAAFWDAICRQRQAIDDDSVPSAYLSEMDQGLYAGLFGGKVQFMAHPENGWISTMVAPLLNDWSEFDGLRFDRSHPWFVRYLHQLDRFVERSAGKFALSHFILIDGLNFVFELVGATRAYLSLDEHPDRVRQAIDFAFALNAEIHQTFFDRVPLVGGGTASNMVQWIPGRIVSESVDPFHMTSVGYFEQWGREPVEKILARFDGGVVHIHGNGRHLLEAVATIRGLKAIYLGDDKGFASAFDVLDALRVRVGEMPLVVQVPCGKFRDSLERGRLAGGVLYHVSDVPDIDTANRLMDRVRAHRTA